MKLRDSKGWLRVVLLAATLALTFANETRAALVAALAAILVSIEIERDLRSR